METQELIKIIDYWQNVAKESAVLPRDLTEKIDLGGKKIVDITGVRRGGKSFVLRSLWQKVSKNYQALYLNFEDPFFVVNFQPEIIEKLLVVFKEYYSPALRFVFLDEVQKIIGWERVVRKYEEGGKIKFFVSGSSAKLLEGELATLLTGRHEPFRLLPLSFVEFLRFQNVTVGDKKDLVLKEKTLEKMLLKYLTYGGFPEVVLTGKIEYAKLYFSDILEKDIFRRFDIRDKKSVEQMAVFLLSNCGNLISQRSLSKLYNLSSASVGNYLSYFGEAFLLNTVSQFSFSLKRTQKALKKLYAVDTGLAGVVSFAFSQDWGRMLENAVFLELNRWGEEVYYYKTRSGGEVDFIIRRKEKLIPIQVCWDLTVPKTAEREIKAFKEAQKELNTREGFILTAGETNERENEIKVLPVIEWLLSGRSA